MNTALEGRQIPIHDATKPQLKAFAEHLGATVANFDNDITLRAKIAAQGWGESYIVVIDAETEKANKAAAKATAAATGKGKTKAAPGPKVITEPMVSITIHVQEGPGGKRPVFVGVNGIGVLIARNVRSTVKLRYLRALESAIETKYEWDDKASINVPADMPSYPHQVHSLPSQREQDEWYAYEAEQEKARLAKDKLIDKAAAREFAKKFAEMMAGA